MIGQTHTQATPTAPPAVFAALATLMRSARVVRWAGLSGALAVSAVLDICNLAQNGYGNTYYAVAARSMLQGPSNFFFGAFDAGGFITVDKPPLALWIQATSASLFGFSGLALLLPQALAGVTSVAVLLICVTRVFGTLAGFVAAMVLATTPIVVAVNRSNNVDSWLMLTVLLATWAIIVATEKGDPRLFGLSMAMIGLAFNVKMLAAWVVLPTFFLLYLLAAPISLKLRVLHLTAGGLIVLVVSLSWTTIVDLTPADARPYVGGSGTTNSALQLALGYNGLERLSGGEVKSDDGVGRIQGVAVVAGANDHAAQGGSDSKPDDVGNASIGNPIDGQRVNASDTSPPGPLRLFGDDLAHQWSWLFPLACFGILTTRLGRPRRYRFGREEQSRLLWVGWLLTYGVVFSQAAGKFHNYYLIMLAPALAALVGAGVAGLWTAFQQDSWRGWLLPLALLAVSAWQMYVLTGYGIWSTWLIPITLVGAMSAALLVVTLVTHWQAGWRAAPLVLAGGVLALSIAPVVWSSTVVLVRGGTAVPDVGPKLLIQPSRGDTQRPDPGDSSLASYVQAHQDGYFYLLAAFDSSQVEALALASGSPALAMGGFTGTDAAMTIPKLQTMIAARQVRFLLRGGRFGSSVVGAWVAQHCRAVQIGGSLTGKVDDGKGADATLYDCSAGSS